MLTLRLLIGQRFAAGGTLRVSSYATMQDKTANMSGNGNDYRYVAEERSGDFSARL